MDNLIPSNMTVELTMLVCSVGLYFVWIMIAAGKALLENGLVVQAGSRDVVKEPSAFLARSRRLCSNMAENLILFTPLVLIANAANISTDLTQMGATFFLYARMAHGVVYLAGWPWVRTLAWFAGVVGMGMIAVELL